MLNMISKKSQDWDKPKSKEVMFHWSNEEILLSNVLEPSQQRN